MFLGLPVYSIGELGWEVYTEMDNLVSLYNTMLQKGKDLDIGHFGTRVINTLRIEKGGLI